MNKMKVLLLLVVMALLPSLPYAAEADSKAFEGSEAFSYRTGENEMKLYVVKPKAWKATDKRSALIHFYGGGWNRGSAAGSVGWARMAANLGMVGIAPDYRVKERHGTTPLEAVADARAALRWVQEHAEELGIDPERIVVSGNSAGGHLALWTGLKQSPPGSDEAEAPLAKPAVLLLSSAVSDTSPKTGYGPSRFGENALALSPVDQLEPDMPAIILFHGDGDATVPYSQAVALNDKLLAQGSTVKFVTVPGGSHNFRGDQPEWKAKFKTIFVEFFEEQGILPAVKAPAGE